MANHTAELIKSLENCRIAWVEEAQTSLSEKPRSVTPDHSRRELGDLVLVEFHAASRMLLMSSFADRSRRTPSW